jgi:hypothetical protein
MTKKSSARLERDERSKQLEIERKNNKAWDDLNVIYSKCINQIFTVNNQIFELYKIPNIVYFLENPNSTTDLIRCLESDLQVMKSDLEKIKDNHSSKTGGWKEDEDFMNCLEVFEAYRAWETKFDGVIMPTVTNLGIDFEKAMVKIDEVLKEAKQNSDLTNPDVVSDAVIKSTEENNE